MKALSLLAGVALLGSVGIASAAEPVTLDENQMDLVVAGVTIIPVAQISSVPGNLGAAAPAGTTNQVTASAGVLVITP